MPTSNTKPQPSAATDKPLGAPGGNEPYKTVRAKNWAQDSGESTAPSGNDPYGTDRAGNTASKGDQTEPAPKPAQGA